MLVLLCPPKEFAWPGFEGCEKNLCEPCGSSDICNVWVVGNRRGKVANGNVRLFQHRKRVSSFSRGMEHKCTSWLRNFAWIFLKSASTVRTNMKVWPIMNYNDLYRIAQSGAKCTKDIHVRRRRSFLDKAACLCIFGRAVKLAWRAMSKVKVTHLQLHDIACIMSFLSFRARHPCKHEHFRSLHSSDSSPKGKNLSFCSTSFINCTAPRCLFRHTCCVTPGKRAFAAY